MPDGVVQWVDPAADQAAIVRASRVFPARAADLEPAARNPGAHVHFDIRREQGVDRAVDVSLRPGTRVSRRQRGFGTLTGARRPDTKGPAPFARPHPELGRSLGSHPLQVVRAWVRGVQAADLPGALSLYAPDARVHVDGDTLAGRAQLQAWLESGRLVGVGSDPRIRGEDGSVLARWDRVGPDGRALEVRSRVEHGLIAEQWVEEPGPTEVLPGGAGEVQVAVTTRDGIGQEEVAYALQRLEAVLSDVSEPILFARLKLGRAGDPARARPVLAQVSLDLDGDLVRAHVWAHDGHEAADLLQRRLRDKLSHRAQLEEDLHTRRVVPAPGEWRHGDFPAPRPEYFPRPAEDRQLVRHKAVALEELTPDEAAFDMDQLDYDFYLFRDLASGQDALLERDAEGSFQLTRLHPADLDTGPTDLALTVSGRPVPVLSVAQALERLDAGGEDHVFFADDATGAGSVAYRRYDGHYGLITTR